MRPPCPFRRNCYTCSHIGQYLECPVTLRARIYAEIKEGGYSGVDPYALLRKVKINSTNRQFGGGNDRVWK